MKFQSHIFHPHYARHLSTIRSPVEGIGMSREEFLTELRQHAFGASLPYALLHKMTFQPDLRQETGVLPNAGHLAEGILTLPINCTLSGDEVD